MVKKNFYHYGDVPHHIETSFVSNRVGIEFRAQAYSVLIRLFILHTIRILLIITVVNNLPPILSLFKEQESKNNHA